MMADLHSIELFIVVGVDGVRRALLHLFDHIFILIFAWAMPILIDVLKAQILDKPSITF